MSAESPNDICSKDVLAMVFLKTKYWGLFRDIEANRDLYTQLRLEDMHASLLFDDKDNEAYRKKHFDELFERLGYGTKDVELLRPILNETFPGWHGGAGINEDELRSNNRIGHRDLLDLYFSYGISHQEFKEQMKHVGPLVKDIAKYDEKSLTRRFKEFNSYALQEEHPGDVARLLARNMRRAESSLNNPMMMWRCWLHALLQHESGTDVETNSILAAILSGANETMQRTRLLNGYGDALTAAEIIDRRVDVGKAFFEDVTKYLADPYLALLMLLFMFPQRGNGFFLDYINRLGAEHLFLPVLGYVDDYYIGHKRNIFQEYDWPYWSFVLYQWSFSISQGSINQAIPNAETRHRRTNDYVFALLKADAKLTYRFIREQFWSDEGWIEEPYKWRIESKIAQYDNAVDKQNLLVVVRRAIGSNDLGDSQKDELREFERLLKRYIASTNTHNDELLP